MARLLALTIPLGLTVSLTACQHAPTQTVPPVPVVSPSASASSPMEPESPQVAAVQDDRFVVTLSSRCPDTWKAMLVREDEADPTTDGRFEVHPKSPQELRLRRGDSIIFTTPHGGIMAMKFDDLAVGHGARVEVSPECTGVQKTIVRGAGSTASL